MPPEKTSLEYYLSPAFAADYEEEEAKLRSAKERSAETKSRNWEALHGEKAPVWF